MEWKVVIDTIWVLLTAKLVFFMNLGFAMVESGFARGKNCVNILSKNFVVFAVSSLGFLFLGWGLMFGDGNPFIGLKGLWFASGLDNSAKPTGECIPRFPGPESPFGRNFSFSWFSAVPPPPLSRAR